MIPNGAAQDGDVSISDIIESIREHARILWNGRRLVARPVGVAVVIGLVIALNSRQEFASGMKLLPYRSAAGGVGSLSGLAGLAGLRLPSGLSDQIITADLYPVIAQTLDFRISVAETPLRFWPGEEPLTPVKYFEEHRRWTTAITDAVADARASISSALTGDKPLVGQVTGADNQPMPAYSRRYLNILEDLNDRVAVTMERKTSVITIHAVMPTRYAATNLAQTVSQKLMHRIIDYEAKKAGEQLAFIEQQFGQSRLRYEKAQRSLAEFTDRNRMLISAVALIEKDRLQRDFDVEFAVLQQLTTELQQARVKKNQDTPVFTILEQAVVPVVRTSPRRTFIVIVWGVAGLVLGLARILYAHYRLSRT